MAKGDKLRCVVCGYEWVQKNEKPPIKCANTGEGTGLARCQSLRWQTGERKSRRSEARPSNGDFVAETPSEWKPLLASDNSQGIRFREGREIAMHPDSVREFIQHPAALRVWMQEIRGMGFVFGEARGSPTPTRRRRSG